MSFLRQTKPFQPPNGHSPASPRPPNITYVYQLTAFVSLGTLLFGYDQGITWDAREISTCMVTGQAAGVAAAMAVDARCAAKDVNISALQSSLRKAGVRLDF